MTEGRQGGGGRRRAEGQARKRAEGQARPGCDERPRRRRKAEQKAGGRPRKRQRAGHKAQQQPTNQAIITTVTAMSAIPAPVAGPDGSRPRLIRGYRRDRTQAANCARDVVRSSGGVARCGSVSTGRRQGGGRRARCHCVCARRPNATAAARIASAFQWDIPETEPASTTPSQLTNHSHRAIWHSPPP
jgi:hypothetical protein